MLLIALGRSHCPLSMCRTIVCQLRFVWVHDNEAGEPCDYHAFPAYGLPHLLDRARRFITKTFPVDDKGGSIQTPVSQHRPVLLLSALGEGRVECGPDECHDGG